jgi:hypothetical protein
MTHTHTPHTHNTHNTHMTHTHTHHTHTRHTGEAMAEGGGAWGGGWRGTDLEGLPPGDVVLGVEQLRVVLEDDVVVLLQELGAQRLVLGQEVLR